jgi:predicted nucleic acid-binding protein
MIIVSDTSPISNLLIVGQLELIGQIYQQVVIPPTVDREVRALQNFEIDLAAYTSATWLSVQMPTDALFVDSLKNELDDGEAEAIALALQLKADRLLIDERLGRLVASRYGLNITGILGILRTAKMLGLIPIMKPILDDLVQQAGFWIDRALYEQVLKDVGE